MQEFNDYKMPDEDSLNNLRQGYANLKPTYKFKVNTLDNNTAQNGTSQNLQASNIFNNINWQRNNEFLRILLNRTNNRCIRNFIRALIPLNEQDYNELNGFYANSTSPRLNPTMLESIPNNFNSALREFMRSELELIDNLLQIMYIDNFEDRRTAIYNIIRRRLDALSTLTNFLSNGGFFA